MDLMRRLFPEVHAAAAYELQVANGYARQLASNGIEIHGKTILELGPGSTPGAALILASRGAQVVVVDRFPQVWRGAYHRRLLRRLVKIAGPLSAVEASIRRGDFALQRIDGGAESMPGVADGAIDIVLSNAVLEHVEDLDSASRELYRVTRSGGIGLHQVDFRDHRSFDRPLDHLLTLDTMDPAHGSRRRCSEYITALERAGFSVSCSVNLSAEPAYFRDFHGRLRESALPYCAWEADDLQILGALLTAHACSRNSTKRTK